ncbi:MAG: AraC family transcriptional regulator [Chitinophagaceae bacterium]|jgi:AraC-like DNA-binding protein|nr:AraC family transcriptional regulator [Chitinophagaceae bacterium]
MSRKKIRDGFEGQKLISIPDSVLTNFIKKNSFIGQLYITHIGYFPKAKFHYRIRKNGCTDNILIYCLGGVGWIKIGAENNFELLPNNYYIIPATEEPVIYGADENDPWTIYWVHFCGEGTPSFNNAFNINAHQRPKEIPFNKERIAVWEEMYESLVMGFSIENLRKANLCLNYFLASLFYFEHETKNESDENDYIKKTIHFMRSNLHEKLSVEEIARKHHLSTSYFSLLFRKSTGMPPIDYFIHLKIQKACQLLYAGNLKVKDVAESLGYDDPFYFSRMFKKYMKVSPEQYKALRKRH